MIYDYYHIAVNDLEYLQPTLLVSSKYNPITVQAQQIAEKMLKSVAELVCVDDVEKILRTHNLKKIYSSIRAYDETMNLDRRDLSFLKDFYFEARNPGDDFSFVDRDECNQSLGVMYSIIAEVNKFRKKYGYEVVAVQECYVPELPYSLEVFS